MGNWIVECFRRLKFPLVLVIVVATVWIVSRERSLTSRVENGFTLPALPPPDHTVQHQRADLGDAQ